MSEFREVSLIIKEIVMNMCLSTPCEREFHARVEQCVQSGYFTKTESEHVMQAYWENCE